MVDQAERQKLIAKYLLSNPNSSVLEISEELALTDRSVRYAVATMINEEKLTRIRGERDNRVFLFSVSTWYAEEITNEGKTSPIDDNKKLCRSLEQTALELEARGFWRRAATVWAELSAIQQTGAGVGVIANRRNTCVRGTPRMRARA